MERAAVQPLENALDGKKCLNHDRTIAFLMDHRPGFDPESARESIASLRKRGYFVHEVTVREFMEKDLSQIGFLLVIPHAQSTPIEARNALELYWKQGGRVLLLGGPLFGKRIERVGDMYVELPLETSQLDANHAYGDAFIMEGVAPTHKVFFEKDVPTFLTEPDQAITRAQLHSAGPETVLCPVARPHGIGFRMEHRNRMISLIQAMGPEGRAQGRRGAAAFLMLSNTRGHLVRTNGTRPGSVSATTPGSCVGGIGLVRQDIARVQGAMELLGDMVDCMCRGVYLYEAGADVFVCDPGKTLRLGARILSLSQDFLPAEICFRILRQGKEIARVSQNLLLSARAYTETTAEWTVPEVGDYEIVTELTADGMVADRICQQLRATAPVRGNPEEFVRAEGSGFVCNGKPWFAYGINYWPLFYPSFDRPDYWMGWMDKANYDPLETERDLAQMADMRINLVCTRLDGDVFGRSMEPLRDFVERCRRHGMKIMLSYPNASNPLYYQPLAVERLIRESRLRDDPILFAHDISWETGTQPLAYLDFWDEGWAEWLVQRYGGVENAQRDWGVPVDRDAAGRPVHPPKEQFAKDGPWRVKICAYRRFIDGMMSRKWNDALRHLRGLDPNHLITYRGASVPKYTGFYLTGTVKHVDFMALEGYTCEQSPEGLGAMMCVSLLARHLSGGKPVTWMEYGLSLVGTSGNSPWKALKWNKETLSAPEEMLEAQREYNQLFFRAFRETGVVGSAPWWYPGGFRRVERSDCGHVNPNGVPRPVWREYLNIADWFLAPRPAYVPDEIISLDPDATAQGWGRYCLGSGMVDRMERDMARVNGLPVDEHPDWGEGVIACQKALMQNRRVDFCTPGDGATSANMPMLAVGNTPLNGSNPPKYLDAEFNTVTLCAAGHRIEVRPGDTVAIPAGTIPTLEASMGNLREAKWLRLDGKSKGSVCLRVRCGDTETRLSIDADTPWLRDATAHGKLPCRTRGATEVSLRMEAVGISAFGEDLRFLVVEKEG